MQKRSHRILRLKGQREGAVLPELPGNKTVKNSCLCGLTILERNIDNNYKAYQGDFLVSSKYSDTIDCPIFTKGWRIGTTAIWKGIPPSGVIATATQQAAEV